MTDVESISCPTAPAWRRCALEAAGHALGPLLLLVLVLAFHPFREVVVFDPDEGNNLMKARLVADGHALYSEIWSDQAPLFTWMLRAWLGLTSWSVEAGRMLVLLCSCVLVWALYQSLRLTAGHLGAVASCVLLVTSAGYLRLSVSVMLATPSLMFAMLSLYAALRYRPDGRAAWLALSGVFLALALGVKMWTGLLVPIVALCVLLAARVGAPAPGGRRWPGGPLASRRQRLPFSSPPSPSMRSGSCCARTSTFAARVTSTQTRWRSGVTFARTWPSFSWQSWDLSSPSGGESGWRVSPRCGRCWRRSFSPATSRSGTTTT
ncbi:MAG: ArnT family glycosyltransferase [Planctomycetota bacterium]|jgi:hypothetical protein